MDGIAEKLIRLFLLLPVFIPAIVLHEYAHAFWAHRCGDMTAKMMGRLTLDPKVHFDPLGALMFVLSSLSGFGFGWAKPVPVSFGQMRNPLKDMVAVSAAGPIANVLQALVWYGIYWIACLAVGPPPPGFYGAPTTPLEVLYFLPAHGLTLNLVLMVFNLIPIPPLDGSRILVGTLPHKAAAFIAGLEPYGMILLLLFLMSGLFGIVMAPLGTLFQWLLILPFLV